MSTQQAGLRMRGVGGWVKLLLELALGVYWNAGILPISRVNLAAPSPVSLHPPGPPALGLLEQSLGPASGPGPAGTTSCKKQAQGRPGSRPVLRHPGESKGPAARMRPAHFRGR